MAQKVFKTMVSLENYIESACEKAVQNACNRLLGALQQIIDEEFYDVFEPDYYRRTYQFWRSATTEMFNKTTGQVFMDADAMDYGSYWTGEKQLEHAAIGSHGGWVTDETKEHRFWEVFIEYCEQNAVKILREELAKQGIKTK